MRNPDPALVLAAARAQGAVDTTGVPAAVLAEADRRAQVLGRRLVACTSPFPAPAATSARPGPLLPALVLGWSEAPVPEDLGTYPIRRLTPTQALVFAVALALAWPNLNQPPYPGRPFTRADAVGVLRDIGIDIRAAKGALDGELMLFLLLVRDGPRLRLGPAVAALPPTFTEAMRRFHDTLPHPDTPPTDNDPDDTAGQGEQP